MDPNEKNNPQPKNAFAGFKVKDRAALVSQSGRLVGTKDQVHVHPLIGARSHDKNPVKYRGRDQSTGQMAELEAPVITPEEIKTLLEYSASYTKFFDYPEGFTPGKKS